jgi:hypothetical protein
VVVGCNGKRSTTVFGGALVELRPPFLLAVAGFLDFLPTPFPLSHVTKDVKFGRFGPFTLSHFTYLSVLPVFSATAKECEQILKAFHPGQSAHVTLPFFPTDT